MNTLPEAALTAHLVALQQRPIAAATRARLAQAMLDWFTAGWAAIDMPAAAMLRRVATDSLPGRGPAAVFGGAARQPMQLLQQLQPLAAGFANAGIAHLREIDDAHRAAMLHPGVVAISPVLALAAAQPMTRRRVADAVIAGYEVALRVGEALGTRHAANFHATATAGTVGAAAASAVALGLSADELHHAMGIAATQSAGLWQLVDDEAHESKSLHPAFAVRNGLMAAWAARAGLPGARAFVSGRRGLHALLAGDGPLAALDGDLNRDVGSGADSEVASDVVTELDDEPRAAERINTVTIKAWPCCAQLFTPLDATRALLEEHRFAPGDIESVQVVIFPHALKIAGVVWPSKPAQTPFSLRYVLVTLLASGSLRIADMELPDLDAPALKTLAARIHVATDDEFQRAFPHKRPSRVTVTLKDGRHFSAYRELRRGDPEDPFTWPQLQRRLRSFVPAMDDATAARLTGWCEAFADGGRDGGTCRPEPALFGG